MIQTTQETDKDDIEQAYLLLLQAKKQMEADEKEIERLRERNMILEQGKELVLIQFSNDILTLLSGFDYATPEKGYDSPSLVLSDLNNFINGLRRGAIAEYQLRVQAEQTLRQMIDELKAVDMGDSETRIRIYHVLNKYNIL
jgi:hypothetical protein